MLTSIFVTWHRLARPPKALRTGAFLRRVPSPLLRLLAWQISRARREQPGAISDVARLAQYLLKLEGTPRAHEKHERLAQVAAAYRALLWFVECEQWHRSVGITDASDLSLSDVSGVTDISPAGLQEGILRHDWHPPLSSGPFTCPTIVNTHPERRSAPQAACRRLTSHATDPVWSSCGTLPCRASRRTPKRAATSGPGSG